MDPIVPFIKEFKDNIISITCFANYDYDYQQTSIKVKGIEIKEKYIYYIDNEEVMAIPIDGAIVDSPIVDIDHEDEEINLITVFNENYGYIKTKKFDF